MQKVVLFFITVCLCQSAVLAQNKNSISGRITDSLSKQGIGYVTITLYDARTNKILHGSTTDSLGNFKFTGIDTGLYNLSFESVGYRQKNIDSIHFKGNHSLHNIGVIPLSKTENTLKEVVVTSALRPMEAKIDKIIFHAEDDVTSQGGVATDILKKIPQVSVDADGNVELAGNSGIRFLINGKPSTAFGTNISDVLQSIPASEIKSIEVMTNPGAKYDAQGLAGVINIILKKSKVNGVNGNVSVSVGPRIENSAFNITRRKGNLGLNAFFSGNVRPTMETPSVSDRLTTDTLEKEYDLLHEQSEPYANRYGIRSGLGFDWTFKKYNSLSGDISYNEFASSGKGIVNQEQKTMPFNNDTIITDIASINDYKTSFLNHSTNAAVNYKRTFAKANQSLEIDASTSLGNNEYGVNNYQTLMPQDSVYYGLNNNNFGKQNETQFEIDYAQPFSENINFDAGTDLTFNRVTSTSNVYALEPASKTYAYDSLVSNYLYYHQAVYAAYAELTFPVGKLFDAKAGSRYERTEINSYYSNATQQEEAPGYNTLVPSIYFFRKLATNQSLKLSFTKRIGRPGYQDLNPFVNTSDPKNITAGNPYLKPEVGHRIELAYNHDYGNSGSFMITAFYRTSNNDIQPYTVFYPSLTVDDTVYKNVSVNTKENVGLERNAGASFFGSLHATNKLDIRTNLFFFRRQTISNIDSGRNPVSYDYRFNINGAYQFTKTLVAEFFGNFNSARTELQGKYPSFTSYTFAARKQLWNKKATIAITATNIFNAFVKQPTVLYGPNFITTSVREIPYRSVSISYTQKFGRLEFKKDKDEN